MTDVSKMPVAAKVPQGAGLGACKDRGVKILATQIAEPFRAEIRDIIKAKYAAKPPLLVGLLGNDDPAARKYAEWTGKAAEADGMRYEVRVVEASKMEQAVEDANADPTVSGVMVYVTPKS